MLKRALRVATRRTVNGLPDVPFMSRFTAVLMPNIIYRGLGQVGMVEREQLARNGEQSIRWAEHTPTPVLPAVRRPEKTYVGQGNPAAG